MSVLKAIGGLNLGWLWQPMQSRRILGAVVRGQSAYAPKAKVTVKSNRGTDPITLVWPDGTSAAFHTSWLRDHCSCKICRHPTNLERNVNTCPPAVSDVISSAIIEPSGQLSIKWVDGHRTDFCTDWLLANRYTGRSTRTPYPTLLPPTVPWDSAQLLSCCPETSFDELQRKEGLRTVLLWLRRYGIAFVRGVPCNIATSRSVLKRLGGVHRILYGEVWQATAKDDPEDQAFSQDAIALHTDCSFLHDVPAVQLFHCYKQADSASSGDLALSGRSQFVDGFFVAERLRQNSPDAFKFLCSTPLRYHYFVEDVVEEKMAHSVAMKKTFALNADEEVVGVCHNSYHRAPVTYLDFEEVPRFYKAMHTLQAELQNPENVFESCLLEGTVALVHNHRVLHGRTAFRGNRVVSIGYMSKDQFEHSLRRELVDERVRSLC